MEEYLHEEHEHHHDGDCCCGHEHHHDEHEHHEHEHEHHEHHHDGDCCCGHEHHEHEHDEHEHASASHVSSSKAPCTVFIMKNIDCANCSAKIEAKVRELPEVDDAVLTFATRQLRVYSAADVSVLLPKMQAIADKIEPGTVIEVRGDRRDRTANAHGHDHDGHNHDGHEHGGHGHDGHDHAHGEHDHDGHGHEHDHAHGEHEEHENDTAEILFGAVMFAGGILFERFSHDLSLTCFIVAYLTLGREILLTAAKNMRNGHVMDENFLMSVATVGAYLIGQYAEAVGVMLFYRIGEAFEHRAVEKSRSQIMEAVDLRPETVLLDEDGKIREIPAEDAREGQIIEVRPGDRIPLDGVVVEGESRIDTSPITGEPVPVSAGVGSEVLSGCVNTSGLLKLRVEKELSESMVTRILDSVENAAASKPQVERFITKFARIYTPIVVGLALATAILPSIVTGNWSYWVYTALTFLVISCPCALVLSVPLAFFSGIGAGSKKGILFKGGVSIEALKNVKNVVMDKTGTITRGNFAVQAVTPADGISENDLLAMAASCEGASTHPIAASILAAAKEAGITASALESATELSGRGIRAVTADGVLLCGNKKLFEEYRINCPAETAGAATAVHLAKDGVYAGTILIADTLKPESASAIAALKKLGIRTAMLTGDNEASANAVAKELGIDSVHARLLPGDKLDVLQKLRAEYGSAMFVGDGINDAPVLAGADVGAAMGSGADAAIEAADVVFMTSSMEAIPESIRIAKKTGAISMQNVVFALTVKILVMILGLAGFASMWMAVFADTGVAMLCVLNSIRVLYQK